MDLGAYPETVGPDTMEPVQVLSLKSSGDLLDQPGLPPEPCPALSILSLPRK